MLAGVAAMLLTRFPTTLEQDRRALAGGPTDGGPQLPPDVRAAVQLRAEKKAVLSEVLQDIGHRIRVRPFILLSESSASQACLCIPVLHVA